MGEGQEVRAAEQAQEDVEGHREPRGERGGRDLGQKLFIIATAGHAPVLVLAVLLKAI